MLGAAQTPPLTSEAGLGPWLWRSCGRSRPRRTRRRCCPAERDPRGPSWPWRTRCLRTAKRMRSRGLGGGGLASERAQWATRRGWSLLSPGGADTYTSLVEVLLDSEGAHPAVALRLAAAQRRQQHERPHPLHLAQESVLWGKAACGRRSRERRAAGAPQPVRPSPGRPVSSRSARGPSRLTTGRRAQAWPPRAGARGAREASAAGPPGSFIAPGGGGRAFVTALG